MTGRNMGLYELETGSVLLVEDWGYVVKDPTHTGIAAGQALLSHGRKASSNVTHAGIADGSNRILEASGAEGLRGANFFDVHYGTKYQVYRYMGNPRIPALAAHWAEKYISMRNGQTNKNVGFGRYDLAGAVGCLFASSKRGTGAMASVIGLAKNPNYDRGFYCSSFVVECYELACADLQVGPVIGVDYRYVSPKMLQSVLRNSKDWHHDGNYMVGGIAS